MKMDAQKPYRVEVIVRPYVPAQETGEPRPHAATLCFEEAYSASDLLVDAINKAMTSDIAIIFAGRNSEMESEGFDMPSIKLPTEQERMIREVAKISRKTVLILYGGNPINISAYENLVDAILFAHFQVKKVGKPSWTS